MTHPLLQKERLSGIIHLRREEGWGRTLGGSFQPCCAAREDEITPVCVCAAVRQDVITCQLGRGEKKALEAAAQLSLELLKGFERAKYGSFSSPGNKFTVTVLIVMM